MKLQFFVIAGVACLSAVAPADFFEQFNYTDGPLTTRPSSTWQLWDPASSGDSAVVSQTAQFNDNTDVIHTFGGVLMTTGSSATISFDFMVDTSTGTGTGTDPNFDIDFAPATAPFTTGELYDQRWGMLFNRDAASGTNGSVAVIQGQGGGNSYYYASGFMTPGVYHHVSALLTRTATNATDVVSLDGTQIFSGTFALTDARGLNAVEFYKNNTGTNTGHIDNIAVTTVPEPATVTALTLGGLALLKRRRR